jgi:predicted RNase H-like HicB family nuclease
MIAIDRYIDVAMRRAFTEQLEDGSWYAEVKVLKGVWATGETEGEALSELRSVIAGWIELKVDKGHRDFPVLGGIDLNRIVRAP